MYWSISLLVLYLVSGVLTDVFLHEQFIDGKFAHLHERSSNLCLATLINFLDDNTFCYSVFHSEFTVHELHQLFKPSPQSSLLDLIRIPTIKEVLSDQVKPPRFSVDFSMHSISSLPTHCWPKSYSASSVGSPWTYLRLRIYVTPPLSMIKCQYLPFLPTQTEAFPEKANSSNLRISTSFS